LRAGEYDRADVAPFHHHASAGACALLLGNKDLSHSSNGSEPRRGLRHFGGSDRLRHFFLRARVTADRCSSSEDRLSAYAAILRFYTFQRHPGAGSAFQPIYENEN